MSSFELFVAWRYLRERGRRSGVLTMEIGLGLIVVGVIAAVVANRIGLGLHPFEMSDHDKLLKQDLQIGSLGASLLGALTIVFGFFHTLQSIFTTISTFGVFLGTAAMCIVLSVMNGFEVDLRQKILGSNAHVLITKEHGTFTEWHEIQKRIDGACAGTVCAIGSTPYLTSEIVIAVSSNYQAVIIKGIDPKTVGNVTDLTKNLTQGSLDRLYPLPVEGAAPATTQAVVAPGEDAEPPDFSGTGGGDGPGHPPPNLKAPDDDPEPVDFSTGDDPLQAQAEQDKTIAALDGLLVGRELAKNLHLYTGEEVEVVSPLGEDTPAGQIPRTRAFRVAGTFFTGMYEYDTHFVYMTIPALQSFLSLGDEVTGIEIKASDIDNTQPLVDELQARLGPGYVVQDWKEINRNLFSALKLEKIAMFLVLAIIILVASFSIVSNLIMVVVEKAREIAIMKSMGASDTSIMRIFIYEGLYIGVLGTVFGLVFGVGICWALKHYGLPLDPDVYYIDRLPVAMDPFAISLVAGAGLAISIIATIYPSMVGAKLRPIDGLRYE